MNIKENATQSPIQAAAVLFGIVFLVVTVAGFVPGLATDYDRLDEFGGVGAKALGIFGVNWLENLVHLAYGVGGLVLASTAARARSYFIVGGILYGVIWIYGMVIDVHGDANVLGVNEAGNWLHAALFLAMVAIGFALGSRKSSASDADDTAGTSGRRGERPLRAR